MSRDPHTSLSLFEEIPPDPGSITPRAAIIPHRESAKPPPSNYHELFVGNDSDGSPSSASKSKSFSGGPRTAQEPIPKKAGAGQHYQPSRLFDGDASHGGKTEAENGVKPNPKKYDHFEFGDGEDETRPPKQLSGAAKAKAANHMSHWDFEDFVTPQKPVPRLRAQDVRHFGWSDDEVNSPVKTKKISRPRRDAETHFEFQDESTPKDEKKAAQRQKGSAHNNGLGLYQNNIYDDGDETGKPEAKPQDTQPHKRLGNATNINSHRNIFGSQFTMTDDSPSSQDGNNNKNGAEKKKSVPADRRAAVKMMNSSWDTYDESPEQQQSKENVATKKKTTGGDGMGGRVGLQRQWGFGDESGGEEVVHSRTNKGKTQAQPSNRTTTNGAGGGGGFWDF
ncbi:MAG: hypothetical protein M1816_005380 [Peltula sp. TS41687]|nr:MAG: hypothetical protein M1816_005380 [Peltula sp. TS41687]